MHTYKYVQSDIFIIIHQHVQANVVTTISLSVKDNTINIKSFYNMHDKTTWY
jgi:hypothetical protein